jgi:hypothetical protein
MQYACTSHRYVCTYVVHLHLHLQQRNGRGTAVVSDQSVRFRLPVCLTERARAAQMFRTRVDALS